MAKKQKTHLINGEKTACGLVLAGRINTDDKDLVECFNCKSSLAFIGVEDIINEKTIEQKLAAEYERGYTKGNNDCLRWVKKQLGY